MTENISESYPVHLVIVFLVPNQMFMACVKHWTFVLKKLHTPLWQALLSILTYQLHRSISQQLIQSTQQGLITSWSLLIQNSGGEFLFAHQQTIPFCMSLK